MSLPEVPDVSIQPPSVPVFAITPPVVTSAPVVVLRGAPGAPGPAGPQGSPSVQWFHGNGPPVDPIIGSHVGDFYVDDLSGIYYKQS